MISSAEADGVKEAKFKWRPAMVDQKFKMRNLTNEPPWHGKLHRSASIESTCEIQCVAQQSGRIKNLENAFLFMHGKR